MYWMIIKNKTKKGAIERKTYMYGVSWKKRLLRCSYNIHNNVVLTKSTPIR